MTKTEIKQLKELAQMLPKTLQDANVRKHVIGSDLIEKGLEKTKTGEKLNPTKFYSVQIADKMPVNHFRRMKNLYQNHGIKAVEKYCRDIHELNKAVTNATI
jgi:hypothetical protein